MFSLGHKKRGRVGTRKEGFGRILYSKARREGQPDQERREGALN